MIATKRERVICAVYTVLWTVYSLQMVLGIGALGQAVLALLITYSLYKVLYVLLTYKVEPFIKMLTVLLLMFSIYGVIYILNGNQYAIVSELNYFLVPQYYYIKNIFCSITIIFVYYDFAKKGVFTKKALENYTTFFVVTAIFSFFSNYALFENSRSFEYIEGVTNNTGYKFVAIIPLLFLSGKRRILYLSICVIFPFLSLKRGAIIIACLGAFMLYRYLFKTAQTSKKLNIFLFGLIGFGIATIGLMHYIETNVGFQKRIQMTMDGDSSGRDDIIQKLVDYFIYDNDDTAMIIGNGADATIGIAGNYAHNDWLEILINQGELGFVLYLIFFLVWFYSYRILYKNNEYKYSYSFGFTMLYFFFASLYSMGYTAFTPPVAIAIAVSLMNYKKRLKAKSPLINN